jgi:hypothetical protein
MRLAKLAALAMVLSATQLWADVSYLMSFRLEPGTGLPPGVAESMAGSMPKMPAVQTRIKGQRSVGQVGAIQVIADNAKKEITLLDPASQTFATATMAEYIAALPKPDGKMQPEVEKMLSNIEITSRKTDRTDVIEGIKVGEREFNLTMKLPLPPIPTPEGRPPAPKSLEMKMAVHMWTALPSELERFAALREIDALYANPDVKVTGRDFIQQLGQMLPGGGESMTKLFDELVKERAYPLRTQMEMSMPGMAEMMEQLGQPAGSAAPPGLQGPLMTMTMELTNFSTEPIDNAVFQVPKNYKPAPFADLVKKLNFK